MYEARKMVPEEKLYAYPQSHQISMQTGLVGHLKVDMGSNGKKFYSTWTDFDERLRTEEFIKEFDQIINELRDDGDFLSSREAMLQFCLSFPEIVLNDALKEFGVRIDTEKHSYLLRMNPNMGEYNLYCYCYQKKWLNHHMEEARKGIQFIDSHYHEKFRFKDGGRIKITYADGRSSEVDCRYIEEYHFEAGYNLYHICEFAERMERQGNKVEPLNGVMLPERGKKSHDKER